MNTPAIEVVIVGGGLSGLTAAAQLGRFGISSVLFDDATEIGGRAKTECRDGFHVNYGPHRLYERGAAVKALRALGVAIDAAPRGPNGGFAVWRGRKYTLPVGFCSLLTTALVGARAKREVASLFTSLPTVRVDALQRVSIGEWLRTHVKDAGVIQVVLAFVRYTTYCDDPERQSAGAAIEQLRLSIGGAVLYIHRGWQALVAGLERAATENGAAIVRGHRVVAVKAMGGRAVGILLADGTCVPAQAVIVATAPRVAQRLLTGAASFAAPTAAVRVAALDVALRRLPAERAIFALAIDEPWSYSADSAIAHVAPRGGAVVHLAKYLRADAAGTQADERQLERALDLLQPDWRELIVHRRFLPAVVVSHALVAADAGGLSGRPTGRLSNLTNVFLAGDWVGPTGQLADASVASGVEAARSVARFLCVESERHVAH